VVNALGGDLIGHAAPPGDRPTLGSRAAYDR
jgi:hypothetical protein